jgi:hypothetical protein
MLVEISVVNTHPPFIILFSYKDGISYSLWMDYFFNESSREEFSYFLFNCLTLVDVHSNYARSAPWHPWHVRWFPCKYISVSLKEADEREFLFLT